MHLRLIKTIIKFLHYLNLKLKTNNCYAIKNLSKGSNSRIKMMEITKFAIQCFRLIRIAKLYQSKCLMLIKTKFSLV